MTKRGFPKNRFNANISCHLSSGRVNLENTIWSVFTMDIFLFIESNSGIKFQNHNCLNLSLGD